MATEKIERNLTEYTTFSYKKDGVQLEFTLTRKQMPAFLELLETAKADLIEIAE